MTLKNNSSMFKKSTKRINSPTAQQVYNHQQQNTAKYQQKPSTFIPQGEKINFQSQDSQGSDISYQSSIQSQEDINIGQIQYFKQQMGRFFINYPQLINDKILDVGDDFEDGEYYDDENGQLDRVYQSQGLNKNWNLLADQILNEAKQSSSFLQSLSRRIALYRSKTHQQDLIDVLLKQEKNIMKDIDLQISLKKKQIKGNKNSLIDHTQAADNLYFSWRKKKELENRLNLQKDQPTQNPNNYNKQQSSLKINNRTSSANKRNAASLTKFQQKQPNKINQNIKKQRQLTTGTFFLTSNESTANNDNAAKSQKSPTGKFLSRPIYHSRDRADSKSMTTYLQTSNINNNKRSYSLNKGLKQKSIDRQKQSNEDIQKQNKTNQTSSNNQNQAFWKHLVNFQPRTQAGRQLCEIIRRTNSPNDQLGIKKTILQFLSRNKEMVQNQMILKSTISQKIQKLYTDDSKQLLMFYPTKMSATQAKSNINGNKQDTSGNMLGDRHHNMHFSNQDNQNKGHNYPGMNLDSGLDMTHKLFDEGEKFMNLLEDIVQGPLMKYWMMIQQKKL